MDYPSGKSTNDLLEKLIKKVEQLQLDKQQEMVQAKKIITASDKLSEEIKRFNAVVNQEEKFITRLNDIVFQTDNLLKRQEGIQPDLTMEQKVKKFIDYIKMTAQIVGLFTMGIQIISEGMFKLFEERQQTKSELDNSAGDATKIPSPNKEIFNINEIMSYANTLLQGFIKREASSEDKPEKPPLKD